MPASLSELDDSATQDDLEEIGLTVQNMVSTLELNRELDLVQLSDDLANSTYEPEQSPFLVYRPEIPGTVLIPKNGIISIVGVKNKAQLEELTSHTLDELSDLGVGELPDSSGVQIQNLVVMGQFNQEIDLPILVAALGMERAEYEPEQFPGIIYRTDDGATNLIFMSGKFIINGKTTFAEAIDVVRNLIDTFRDIGLSVDLKLH